MAYEYLILVNEENSLTTRWIQAYMRNTPNPEVRLAGVEIGIDEPLSSIDLAAAFAAGEVVPNGTAEWNRRELEEVDDLIRNAIGALLDVVRADGNLLAMVTALEGVIDDDAKLQVAYNRIRIAFAAGSGANQTKFIAALAALTYYRLGQRAK